SIIPERTASMNLLELTESASSAEVGTNQNAHEHKNTFASLSKKRSRFWSRRI
ncbi:hypothetical protein PISMIDRAFT_424526, partial [Pisolithus microcarpus 441]